MLSFFVNDLFDLHLLELIIKVREFERIPLSLMWPLESEYRIYSKGKIITSFVFLTKMFKLLVTLFIIISKKTDIIMAYSN